MDINDLLLGATGTLGMLIAFLYIFFPIIVIIILADISKKLTVIMKNQKTIHDEAVS